MKKFNITNPIIIICCCLLLFCSCAPSGDDLSMDEFMKHHEDPDSDFNVQLPDSSCAYFYLLWGTHSENSNNFPDAEEALGKAYVCNPESHYILRRLSVLNMKMNKPQEAAEWLEKAIKQFPGDVQDRMFLARIEITNGNIDAAIRLYQDVLKDKPEDESILLRIGFLYLKQNKVSRAREALQKALKINPEAFFAHLYLARLSRQYDNADKAAQHYQKALSLNRSVELALETADFYSSVTEFSKADSMYKSILQKHPDNLQAGLGLTQLLLQQEKEKEAFNVLHELRKNSSTPEDIDMIIARMYLRANDLEMAADILEPLVIEKGIQDAAYMLAVIRFQQKRIADAALTLKHITKESEYYEDAVSLKVRIFIEQDKLSDGIVLLEKELQNNKDASPGLYTLLASLYMEQKMFQESYTILDTALSLYPKEPKVYFEYGLLLEKDNKREEAVKEMSKILELDPDHAEALNYIGYTWADQGINLEQALIYIKKAVKLKPDNGYIRDSLGWVYFRMGTLQKAAMEIKKALELEPKDPNIHEHLGDIYVKLGDTQKAIKAYQDALKLFKNKAKQQEMRQRINALSYES